LAWRVIQYLKTLPEGKWIASGPLSAAMDQPSSAVITALNKSIDHGLLRKKKINGLYHFALGDGTPLPRDDDEPIHQERAQPQPAERAKPNLQPRQGLLARAAVRPPVASQAQTPAGVDIDAGTPRRINHKKSDRNPVPAVDAGATASATSSGPQPEESSELSPGQPFAFLWHSNGAIILTKNWASIKLDPTEYQRLQRFMNLIGAFEKEISA
jgi:hypothetical protein